jgi:hypothetical protein
LCMSVGILWPIPAPEGRVGGMLQLVQLLSIQNSRY